MINPLQRGASRATPADSQAVAVRVAVIGAGLLVLFAIVFFRLWYLQVLSGNSFAARAVQNRTRTMAITAPRGDITDSSGHTLVRTRRELIVSLNPMSVPDERSTALAYGQALTTWSNAVIAWQAAHPKTKKWSAAHRRRVGEPVQPPFPTAISAADQVRYARLSKVLSLKVPTIHQRVIGSILRLPYSAVNLKIGVQPAVLEYIQENSDAFPGITAAQEFVRSYPHGSLAAHLLGYVSPLTQAEIDNPDSQFKLLPPTSEVGQSGVEFQYDSYLRGVDGKLKARVNALGELVGQPTRVEPRPGDGIQLSLDSRLQKAGEDAFAAGPFNPTRSPGAFVALDPTTGAVLAMGSYPTYDPSDFTRPMSTARSYELFKSPSKPFFNRALSGLYPTGSTFKAVTTLAGYAAGTLYPGYSFDDIGFIKVSNQTFWNSGHTPYGHVDLQKAIQVSSDAFFYTQGEKMNVDPVAHPNGGALQQWARKLGFGQAPRIDIPGATAGTVPDAAWRNALYAAEVKCEKKRHVASCGLAEPGSWTIGNNIQLAVGQGDLQASPLQLAVAYSAVENGGKLVTPHVGGSVQNRSGGVTQTLHGPAPQPMSGISQPGLEALREGLHMATSQQGGTSQPVFANWPQDKYPVYGKTGTAERAGKPDQAWYAAFVPNAKRPIVIVATVENGGFGATTAAPIVGTMLKEWYGLSGVKIQAGTSATR